MASDLESEGLGSCCGSESGAPGDIEKKPGSPALSFRGERGLGEELVTVLASRCAVALR